MNKTETLLEFTNIKEQLTKFAHTNRAKQMIAELTPFIEESKLRTAMRYTTEARWLLDNIGEPPISNMDQIEEYVELAGKGELLMPEQLEAVSIFLAAVKRIKAYLTRGMDTKVGLAYYNENLVYPEELHKELERSIRYGKVDDYATPGLRQLRTKLVTLEEKVKIKAESALKTYKEYASDSFCVLRNGRWCLPVKSAFKNKIKGTVADKSATGATLFIEPAEVSRLYEEIELCKIEEDTEERRILYTLCALLADEESEVKEDMRVVVLLDFLFAKGKLSQELDAIEPTINTSGYLYLREARHPLLNKEECVPLDFEIGKEKKGIIITGPNTGGKTVSMKTVGLFTTMALSGLHIPCKEGNIAMFSQILCDIGDGQNMADNLSTFSAHLKTLLTILETVNEESLVLLDELGSGTDPAEGMGIAVAILEQLRKSGCLFLVTTHYPEVKEYAGNHEEIVNARMAFDRDSLRPLYTLEIGKAGDSCALYIAKRLGLPNYILKDAAKAAYGKDAVSVVKELDLDGSDIIALQKRRSPKIQRIPVVKGEAVHGEGFVRGDSVTVSPENVIGIIVKPANSKGEVLVQIKKEKLLINHKRLQLKVAATKLYPEDYDFSIIFDTVENRKAHHQMSKHHVEGLEITTEE